MNNTFPLHIACTQFPAHLQTFASCCSNYRLQLHISVCPPPWTQRVWRRKSHPSHSTCIDRGQLRCLRSNCQNQKSVSVLPIFCVMFSCNVNLKVCDNAAILCLTKLTSKTKHTPTHSTSPTSGNIYWSGAFSLYVFYLLSKMESTSPFPPFFVDIVQHKFQKITHAVVRLNYSLKSPVL